MTINSSRAQQALLCWRKAFNDYHRNLQGQRSMNLVDGGAFHAGVAVGMATHDWEAAHAEAERVFQESRKQAMILPQLEWEVTQHNEIVHAMLEKYREHYEEEQYQIVQPECEFCVPIEGTEHNCILIHHLERVEGKWVERWGPPTTQAIIENRVAAPHVHPIYGTPSNWQDCKCWQPHRITGKTDALVLWHQNLWLLEHKTTSMDSDQFWGEFRLNIQPTIYMLGMWRATGIRPSGFVLNAVFKPSENQVANWNSKRKDGDVKHVQDYIRFKREPYTRTIADLERCERELAWLCDEWEQRVLSGRFPMSPVKGTCYLYNRACDYHAMCLEHDSPEQTETMYPRQLDYVDNQLVQLAGLPALEDYRR